MDLAINVFSWLVPCLVSFAALAALIFWVVATSAAGGGSTLRNRPLAAIGVVVVVLVTAAASRWLAGQVGLLGSLMGTTFVLLWLLPKLRSRRGRR